MNQQSFGGDKKVGRSLLSTPETRLKNWVVPRNPPPESKPTSGDYHPWPDWIQQFWGSRPEILACLWFVSLMIVLQYLTDLFDGEVGRQRNTGLIKWGFYMDHFLDYLFLSSLVFVGYMISPTGSKSGTLPCW